MSMSLTKTSIPSRMLHCFEEHFDSSDDDYDLVPKSIAPLGLLQRFVAFMSRTPLLLRSSPAHGTGSYGSLPVHDLSFSTDASEIDDEVVDDIRRRDRRKGKGSALRQVETNGSSRSRRTGTSDNGSTSAWRSRRRQSRRDAEPTLAAGTAIPAGYGGKLLESILPDTSSASSASRGSKEDEDADSDGDNSIWSDENPPDNSPSVKSSFSNLSELNAEIASGPLDDIPHSRCAAILPSQNHKCYSDSVPSASCAMS